MDDYYVSVNGEYRLATEEEKKKALEEQERWEQEQAQNPHTRTLDERVTVLEQDMADIKVGYAEGVNNA